MIATHLVKVSYFVSAMSDKTPERIRQEELAKWKLMKGDALENVEIEDLKSQ